MTRWLFGLALLSVVGVLAWRFDRRQQKPLAEIKRASFLKDLTPAYRQTQAGPKRKQHRPVLRYRYPRKSA